MNSETKTTRKDFLKWSGIAAIGGMFLDSGYIFGRKKVASEKSANTSESLNFASRVRTPRNAVVRKSV